MVDIRCLSNKECMYIYNLYLNAFFNQNVNLDLDTVIPFIIAQEYVSVSWTRFLASFKQGRNQRGAGERWLGGAQP